MTWGSDKVPSANTRDFLAIMVAIAHGKGVIYCHQYHGKIDGEKFADFVRGHFPALFELGNNVTGRLFLQDADPSQCGC